MTLTDPPYNVAYTGKTKDALTIDNDSFSDEDSFKAFLTQAFALAERHMRPGAAFYVFHADRHGLAFRQACEDAGLPVRQVLQWVKQSFVLGRQDYQWRHEPCLYGWKPGAAHYFLDSRSEDTVMEDEEPDVEKMRKAELQDLAKRLLADRKATTVMKFDRPSRSEDHPTMKPVKLLAYLVRNSTRRGQTVLDPFSGSGSTLIACEQLDRRCFAMELDPHYCDVIIERWERLTGLEAVKDG